MTLEAWARQSIDCKLLETCGVDISLQLPQGIIHADGVKANLGFFDAAPEDGKIYTVGAWIYDLCTNKHFTTKAKSFKSGDFGDSVAYKNPQSCHDRKVTDSINGDTYKEMIFRDKASFDSFWCRNDSLDNRGDQPTPNILAQESTEHLEPLLASLRDVAAGLPKFGK